MCTYRVVSTDIADHCVIDSEHRLLARAIAAAKKAQRQHDDRGNQIQVTVESRAADGSWWQEGRAQDY